MNHKKDFSLAIQLGGGGIWEGFQRGRYNKV